MVNKNTCIFLNVPFTVELCDVVNNYIYGEIIYKFMILIHFSIAPYCCFLCKNKFLSLPITVAHVEIDHPDWQAKYCETPGYEPGLVPGSSQTHVEAGCGLREGASTPTAGLSSSFLEMEEEAPMLNIDTSSAGTDNLGATVHNNRNWFSEMEECYMVNIENSDNIAVHFLISCLD